jgi:TusA-related sulfurtransferase
MSSFDLEVVLDDISCSWRILRLRNAIDALPSGARVLVTSTDRDIQPDLEAFVRQSGNLLLGTGQTRDRFTFAIQKV